MKKENKDIREYPSPPFHEPRQHPPASEQEMDLKTRSWRNVLQRIQ